MTCAVTTGTMGTDAMCLLVADQGLGWEPWFSALRLDLTFISYLIFCKVLVRILGIRSARWRMERCFAEEETEC